MDKFGGASSSAKVGESFFVDWEIPHRGSVFRGHVGDGRAIGEGQFCGPWAIEFDEFTDDFVLPKDLGDGECEIGGGRAGRKFPREIESNDFRGQEGEGLTEHASLGLNSADAPTNNSKTVNHRGVGVRPNEGVWVGDDGAIRLFFRKYTAGEVFEVYLMNDSDAGGNNAERLEGLLSPFEEFVAFPVAFEFVLHVEHERLFRAVDVDLNGVIDHEIDGDKGFNEFGIFFKAGYGIPHGS